MPRLTLPRSTLPVITALCLYPGLGATQAPGLAQSSIAVRAGAWQVVSGAPGQPMVGYQVCLKNGADDVALLLPRAIDGGPACSAASTRREGSQLYWELSCAPGTSSGVTAASARYTLAPELIEGEIRISTAQPPQTRLQTLSARYAGPCP